MLNKILPLSIRVLIGSFFIFSGFSKLYPVEPFEFYFVENGLSNWFLAPYITRIVIAWEFFLGLCLISNIYLKKTILKATLVTLTLFTLYIIFLLITKGSNADCGCFGDTLKMGAWPSLFKNIGLLIGVLMLIVIESNFLIINKLWVVILAFLISFSSPFILNVPENYSLTKNNFGDNFNLGKDFSNLLKDNNIDIKNEQIIVFFSPSCSHCKMAAKKLNVMLQKQQIDSIHVFIFGDSEGATSFFNETKTVFNYSILDENVFFKFSGPILPSIYELNAGKVVKHDAGGYFNPYLFTKPFSE